MAETIFVGQDWHEAEGPVRVCDACLGDGGWNDADPRWDRWLKCRRCWGTGYVEDDSVPVTEEDVMEPA